MRSTLLHIPGAKGAYAMDESWKPLVDDARSNWQHAWRERARGGFASGAGNSRAPYRDALNDLPAIVRDQLRKLDDGVEKWLHQLSDLRALSDATGTAEELIGKIRDGAKNAVDDMRRDWMPRRIDE